VLTSYRECSSNRSWRCVRDLTNRCLLSLTYLSDHYEEEILVPRFIGQGITAPCSPSIAVTDPAVDEISGYNWGLKSVPQTYLSGQAVPLPLGKVLGGGSILNGWVWHRGFQADFNAWVTLGNTGWGWSDLLPYFMKVGLACLNLKWYLCLTHKQTENFTLDVTSQAQSQFGIHENMAVHGTTGYVHVSYPKYIYQQTGLSSYTRSHGTFLLINYI
jgi:choline dehydrogenase-like flavoprotein